MNLINGVIKEENKVISNVKKRNVRSQSNEVSFNGKVDIEGKKNTVLEQVKVNRRVEQEVENEPYMSKVEENFKDGDIEEESENRSIKRRTIFEERNGESNDNFNSRGELIYNNPHKLNDAITAAGIDIQQEEDNLQKDYGRRYVNQREGRIDVGASKSVPFLNFFSLATLMNRLIKQNGMQQNFFQDGEILQFISELCEKWLSLILIKTFITSKHRRNGITGKKSNFNGVSKRSQISSELQNIALRQKKMEEKRVKKRIELGLEKDNCIGNSENGEFSRSKISAEETLHKAANATAAIMTMNPSRKKYSWMNTNFLLSSGNGTASSVNMDNKKNQSSLISIRKENGLFFKELRPGNFITLKDLLDVLEDEKLVSKKALIKGYARLKD